MDFVKISATGNDFIAIDNRSKTLGMDSEFFRRICARRTGIGADGIVILGSSNYDFSMTYLNNDGQRAAMCGNGARSIIRFASFLGIKKSEYLFNVGEDCYRGGWDGEDVYLIMKEIVDFKQIDGHCFYMNTGVPHLVLFEKFDLQKGRDLRLHYDANVDFVEASLVRTYERGVEGETLSCGTGAVAVAYVLNKIRGHQGPITINTLGGILRVEISGLRLSGKVALVYKGELF
jgi:diaminopimelate epimerase